MVKKILLKPRFKGWNLHSLYSEIVMNPPEGFLVEYENVDTKNSKIYSLDDKSVNPLLKELIYHFKPIPYIFAQKMQKNDFNGYDLVYASQHVIFDSRLPWITDLEFANALAAYGNISIIKNIIRKQLESSKCKFIIPWSQWSNETLARSINCSNIKDKIKVIRYTVSPKKFSKKNHDEMNFLFVGSGNVMNTRNVQFKNLKEVILAFNNINKKYDKIHLTVRSYLPADLKALASKNPKIMIIDHVLTKEELFELYTNSDVFVLPSHETCGIALLDAMSFELPVIAMNVYDVPEVVSHMKNGILLESHKKMRYYTDTMMPYDYSQEFARDMKKYSDHIVKQLEFYFSKLIEDAPLRRDLGREARMTIESGELSIKKRNDALLSVFEAATK